MACPTMLRRQAITRHNGGAQARIEVRMSESAAAPLPEAPPAPERLLRMVEVERQTGISRSQLYRLIAAGDFPRSVSLYGRSKAWVESQVQAWIAARIAASLDA